MFCPLKLGGTFDFGRYPLITLLPPILVAFVTQVQLLIPTADLQLKREGLRRAPMPCLSDRTPKIPHLPYLPL